MLRTIVAVAAACIVSTTTWAKDPEAVTMFGETHICFAESPVPFLEMMTKESGFARVEGEIDSGPFDLMMNDPRAPTHDRTEVWRNRNWTIIVRVMGYMGKECFAPAGGYRMGGAGTET